MYFKDNLRNVVEGRFACSTNDELDRLGDALVRGEELYMDDEGIFHFANDSEGLTTLNTSNMTKVNKDPFAGQILGMNKPEENRRESQKQPEISIIPVSELPFFFDDSPNDNNSSSDEVTTVDLQDSQEYEDEADVSENEDDSFSEQLSLDVLGTVSGNEDQTDSPNESLPNCTKVKPNPFASPQIPSFPDQWYNKNPTLFRGEVASMKMRHPKAILGFFEGTGNMYWIVTLKVCEDAKKPWTFLLEYGKKHPNNLGYGGSIRVQLLKSPSLNELKKRAKEHGRPGVPHVVQAKRANGENYEYLCTRFPKDIQSGNKAVTSAVQVAGWAGDWALHFEKGMVSARVWNQWCDDEHFRWMQV